MNNLSKMFMYKFLCGLKFACLLRRYLGVEFLGQTVTLFNLFFFKELTDCFPKWLYNFTFLATANEGFIFLKFAFVIDTFVIISF